MRIAMLAPIAWRTPPRHYGPWEFMTSLLTEKLVEKGIDVTLFATADSQTAGKLHAVCPRPCAEDSSLDPKVWECLHISELFERAGNFDLIHNNFDFLPLTFSGLVPTPVITTIHGFSSEKILPVFKKYNRQSHYVAISDADRSPELDYIATVHHGIDLNLFPFTSLPDDYLLFFGRIHHDKGVVEAIETALTAGKRLVIAGIIQDERYFREKVEPRMDGDRIKYIGPVGQEKRPEILGKAAALLHLINFDEPFGLSMVESMACGTPVIARGRGSVPEIVVNGRNGFIVNSVEEAVSSVGMLDEIDRSVCRENVEKRFTADRMADEYIELYRKVLEQRENYRPWGHYENLEEDFDHKLKRITVEPGKRLSYQKHAKRAERWVIIRGEAVVTLDGKDISLKAGDTVFIPKGSAHRIANTGDEPLLFAETQLGDYFGEDDIVRLEDDFGRTDCS